MVTSQVVAAALVHWPLNSVNSIPSDNQGITEAPNFLFLVPALGYSNPTSFWWLESNIPASGVMAFFPCWSLGMRSLKWRDGRQSLNLSRILNLSVIEEWGPEEPQNLKLWRRKCFYIPHGFSDSHILHSGYMGIGSMDLHVYVSHCHSFFAVKWT